MSRDCNSLIVLAILESMYGQEGLEGKSNNLMRNCSNIIYLNKNASSISIKGVYK